MKAPVLGYGDIGLGEQVGSANMNEWMKEVTARINRLEAEVHGRHIPKHEITLSAKQAEVYQFIANKLDSGENVSLQDICERFDYKGTSSAQRMVDSLRAKNMVSRKGHKLSLVEEQPNE